MEEEKSFAMTILDDYKKQNRNQFIVILVILALWFATGVYLVYVLNDIGKTTKEIDIEDVEVIDKSHIKIGDDIYQVGEDKWEE